MARPQTAVLRGVIAAIDAHGPMTLRQLLDVVQVQCNGRSIYTRKPTVLELRRALSNGLRTGNQPLECCGKVRQSHCNRWCTLYGVREAVRGVTDVARAVPNIDRAALQASAALQDFGLTILAWHHNFRPA
jgi:hypothetical protein